MMMHKEIYKNNIKNNQEVFVNNMKRFINVINKNMRDELSDLGFRYTTQIIDDREVYVFIESDKLYKILNNKCKFSKKDYYHSNIMKF